MTPEQLVKARAKEAADKRTFRRIIIGLPIVLVCVALFAVADAFRAPRYQTFVRVVGFKDIWTLKHGQRCLTSLDTTLGQTTIWTTGHCHEVRWHIGQTLPVEATVFRLTGFIAIDTHRAALAGAHGLPMF